MSVAQSKNKKKTTDNILKYFSHLFQKTGFDISCKLSPKETVCLKYQTLFSKKNIIKLLSVEFAMRMVKVKLETNS